MKWEEHKLKASLNYTVRSCPQTYEQKHFIRPNSYWLANLCVNSNIQRILFAEYYKY